MWWPTVKVLNNMRKAFVTTGMIAAAIIAPSTIAFADNSATHFVSPHVVTAVNTQVVTQDAAAKRAAAAKKKAAAEKAAAKVRSDERASRARAAAAAKARAAAPRYANNLNGWIAQCIAKTHAPGWWANGLKTIALRESSGNPRAFNGWDSNAAAGIPSKGLMQTIEPTFRAYHQSGTSWDIFDPVANCASSVNYIKSRYGSISNVQQANPAMPPKGY